MFVVVRISNVFLATFGCFLLAVTDGALGDDYKVVAQRIRDSPIISRELGSPFDYNSRAAMFDTGVQGKLGILVKTLNKQFPEEPYNVGGAMIAPALLRYTEDGIWHATMPNSSNVFKFYTPSSCGTEDARVVKDGNDIFLVNYNSYDCQNAKLTLAHSRTPEQAKSWIVDGFAFPNISWTKEGAMLLAAPENGLSVNYLFFGNGSKNIHIANSAIGKERHGWNDLNRVLLEPRPNHFDSMLVEVGAPPLRLTTGDFLFLYNGREEKIPSVRPYWDQRNSLGFAILDRKDPTKVLHRSSKPLLEPKLFWEIGNSSDFYRPNEVYNTGLLPDPQGCKHANVSGLMGAEFVAKAECFIGLYSAAETVTGIMRVIVSRASLPPTTTQPPTIPSSSVQTSQTSTQRTSKEYYDQSTSPTAFSTNPTTTASTHRSTNLPTSSSSTDSSSDVSTATPSSFFLVSSFAWFPLFFICVIFGF